MDEEEYKNKIMDCTREILELLQSKGIRLSEASGILGGVFASIVVQTEENFPFISFWNSFTRTYSINYDGSEIHNLAGPCKIFKEQNEK